MRNLKHCQKSVPRDHVAKMDSDRTVRRTGSLSSAVHRTVHKAGSLSRDAVGNADERAAALRNLKHLQRSDPRIRLDESFVAKYLALREVRGAHGRINSKMLLNCVAQHSQRTALKRKLWILSKSRRPHLDKEIDSAWLVNPERMAELPAGLVSEQVWVVDQAYPVSRLGPGALEWETSVGTTVHADDIKSQGVEVRDTSCVSGITTASASATGTSYLRNLDDQTKHRENVFDGIAWRHVTNSF